MSDLGKIQRLRNRCIEIYSVIPDTVLFSPIALNRFCSSIQVKVQDYGEDLKVCGMSIECDNELQGDEIYFKSDGKVYEVDDVVSATEFRIRERLISEPISKETLGDVMQIIRQSHQERLEIVKKLQTQRDKVQELTEVLRECAIFINDKNVHGSNFFLCRIDEVIR